MAVDVEMVRIQTPGESSVLGACREGSSDLYESKVSIEEVANARNGCGVRYHQSM